MSKHTAPPKMLNLCFHNHAKKNKNFQHIFKNILCNNTTAHYSLALPEVPSLFRLRPHATKKIPNQSHFLSQKMGKTMKYFPQKGNYRYYISGLVTH